MTEYVVGLSFTKNMQKICLIKKERPSRQEGYYNGIGGKIENDELPIDAMVREYLEETGVYLPKEEWDFLYFTEYENGNKVYFYRIFSDEILNAKTITDEEVVVADLLDVKHGDFKLVGDLEYYISLALSPATRLAKDY